jgi:predicted  nucleic acid-binding Zn-ribbon protein
MPSNEADIRNAALATRLRVQSNTEEVMKSWDTLRAYLLDGGRGSLARDIFESILSRIDEEREEAADHIEALERKVGELEAEVATYQGLLDAAIDDYNDAIKPKPDDKPFTFADPNAQREWERQRKERGE